MPSPTHSPLVRIELPTPAAASRHYRRPTERGFTREERDRTTVLFGGLTWKHEALVQAAFTNLGYRAESLPDPDVAAFQAGKEYGNNGQCNPTYFTVGNLVRHLQSLEARGMSRAEIIETHVFLTAGACGPCRFGMYESEYRLALRNSGFEGFRVLLFDLGEGMEQSVSTQGLLMNQEFFLGILNALNAADVLNEMAALTRPFERQAGATANALRGAVDLVASAMKTQPRFRMRPAAFEDLGRLASQLLGRRLPSALAGAGRLFDEVPVDRLQVKPVVKVIGEFWAQTTEGDGNYRMVSFLEREGAQVLLEPIASLILYMIHQAVQQCQDRRGLMPGSRMKEFRLRMGEAVFRYEYRKMLAALGGAGRDLLDQRKLRELARGHYDSRAEGGEGHTEIAKNIYYARHRLAHMVLSLKPFGCMPSTQSDAVQAAVVAQEQDMVYLAVETSGEGEINAHSRVQMALSEARAKALREFAGVLQQIGWSHDDLRRYADAHPELSRQLYRIPPAPGLASMAARTAIHIAERARRERWTPKAVVAVA
ncbi:MAG: hypothetical protein K2X03_16055 [Bryobacteraceae bacterium]|nr:hypothetical protein [Bryobacteraceae bacterium]